MDIQYTITQLRQLAGLSQKAIGKAIGCSQPNVSDMETGKSGKKRPSFDLVSNLKKLAKKHSVPTEPGPPSSTDSTT